MLTTYRMWDGTIFLYAPGAMAYLVDTPTGMDVGGTGDFMSLVQRFLGGRRGLLDADRQETRYFGAAKA